MSLPRYPSYKDSGVEWLGKVPGHWEVSSLKRSFQIVGGSTPKSENEFYWDGDILWATPSDLSKRESLYLHKTLRTITAHGLASCGTTLVPMGSIILSTRAPIGSLAIAAAPMCTNQGCKSLVPAESADASYFAYLLTVSSTELNIRGKGTTFLELSADELGAFKTPSPPHAEQTQIAAFLDRETAKIDELVAEQRRLMALLKEKRQAVISHAVTRGLNPHAPLKPSGIEWLGDVPEHWDVCSIRRVVSEIEQGWSPECHSRLADDDEWGVLKAGCVNRGTYDEQENKALPEELVPAPEYEVCVGDVLMSRASGSPELVGSTALVTSTRPKLMLSDKIFRLRFELVMEPGFFVAALNSRPLRSQIEQALSGGNGLANNLPQSALLGFFLCVPSVLEQREICAFLQAETTKLDTLTAEAQRAIDLLQERRTALISAAVTGQIDVRDAVSA